jgi:hypothetical protein
MEGRVHHFLQQDIDYVIRLDEVLWGCLLLAITLVIHGAGMLRIVRVGTRLLVPAKSALPGFRSAVLIFIVLAIVVLHLVEVEIWAAFFTWKDAQPNPSSAFYNALVNYTALGAGYLPIRWRLLEGMLGMAGLLCFAFSTSALLAFAQKLVHLDASNDSSTRGKR